MKGPLRIHRKNSRYFTDESGKVIYLTGSHVWNNLQDIGTTDPPAKFNFYRYLDFLQRHHHNFIRLWRWELPRWRDRMNKQFCYSAPHPWQRTGPGTALDGGPKFDLERFDAIYFDRLRSRVALAAERNVYVSIMLFEGWGLSFASWDSHPFNVQNNIQGINGDPKGIGKGTATQSLNIPEVTRIQEAYVRRVIDTVNDLDNALFEIANESNFAHSHEWQYHLVRYIRDYESGTTKQHPIGMTGYTRSDNRVLRSSPADWISPGGTAATHEPGPYKTEPPVVHGDKVVMLDTDHIWGVGGGREWVWKSFLRGYNPVWMDPYENPSVWEPVPSNADEVRRNLGTTRRYAEKMDLAPMSPANHLVSTKYCLALPGSEYLAYLPEGGTVTVNLLNTEESFAVEWHNPSTGQYISAGVVFGGARRKLRAPFHGDAVVYLVRV